MTELLSLLAIDHPIIQAPMAGVSTPAMAAAVANAGALGSLGVGAMTAVAARTAIDQVRALTSRSINLNVFCHRPARRDATIELAWIERLRPELERFGAAPPAQLSEIYTSFLEDDAMLALLLEAKPKVVSFHFGIPAPDRVKALRDAGIVLLAGATNLAEARALVAGGVHAVVAQGYEAGGHRGVFDEHAVDDRLGTLALVRILACDLTVPVIAAGGIMDGAGISAALRLGASAAQLGTAFIDCPESQADVGFRRALHGDGAHHTMMTRALSGRPARCIANRFTTLGANISPGDIPAYPVAYDLGKALHAAAKVTGEYGYGAQLAGQGAPLARTLPAAELVAALVAELG